MVTVRKDLEQYVYNEIKIYVNNEIVRLSQMKCSYVCHYSNVIVAFFSLFG